MFWTKSKASARTLTLSIAALCLAAAGLIVGAQYNSIDASTSHSASLSSSLTLTSQPAATFIGNNVGAIPDATAGQCWGAFVPTPRIMSFNVSGVAGPPTNVELSTTFSPNHSWVGDVRATLIAPNGASHIVFSRTGATASGASGDSSDLAGPYNFRDSAAGVNWWTEAANRLSTEALTAGDYRTTTAGGVAGAGTDTSMTPSFAGVANPTGMWTLRLEDGCAGDTGSISAATLTITGGPAVVADAPVDFTGDGKTDYAVVRNTGGGPGGQITWFYDPNGGGATQAFNWGIAADFFVPEDYDGDGKDDIAVWRPGAAGTATWYILNSNGFTARVEAYGQTGDDPSVVGDYNNDGKADLAVYRLGVAPGLPSNWIYRTVANGPVNYVPWGVNGDFPAPGDYDGDGSNDFVIQRNTGGGQARFWIRLATGVESSVVFGTPTDVIVPGDYDGDGKTDIAVARGIGGNIAWFYDPSGIAGVQVVQNTFGVSATDFPAQGDYDGDGKTDIAIWRPSATPGASVFWSFNSLTSSPVAHAFGSNGDYPVANYNTH